MRQSAKYAAIAYSRFSDMPNLCVVHEDVTNLGRHVRTASLRGELAPSETQSSSYQCS